MGDFCLTLSLSNVELYGLTFRSLRDQACEVNVRVWFFVQFTYRRMDSAIQAGYACDE
jgi:hypothetical protein